MKILTMNTVKSLTNRLDSLEKHGNNDTTYIFVEYEGTSAEDSTRHIYNRCAKCCDPDIFAKALGEATKRNQANIVVITKEEILGVVQRLKEQGIEVLL